MSAADNEPAIKGRIRKAVSDVYDESTGQVSREHATREAFDAIDLDEYEKDALAILAIQGEVDSQRKTRRVENQSPSANGALWTNEHLDQLMAVAPGVDIKVRHATRPILDQHREAQLMNMRRTNAAFERSEQRREVLFPLMDADDSLTVEDALRQIGELPTPQSDG